MNDADIKKLKNYTFLGFIKKFGIARLTLSEIFIGNPELVLAINYIIYNEYIEHRDLKISESFLNKYDIVANTMRSAENRYNKSAKGMNTFPIMALFPEPVCFKMPLGNCKAELVKHFFDTAFSKGSIERYKLIESSLLMKRELDAGKVIPF